MRTVISHYHIYKNSGTSFDHVLTHSFGEKHELFDGPYPFFRINQMELDRIIMRRSNAVAFSSHQTFLPKPASMNYRVLAAVFIRHPILRIGSIYRFKRKYFDGTSTSKAAQEMNFEKWLSHCFADRAEITHISNAQTRILGSVYGQQSLQTRKPSCMEYDLNSARQNLASVELLGRTEHFEEDVNRFVDIGLEYGLKLRLPKDLHQNTTQIAGQSVEDRLSALLDPLPEPLQKQLMASNQQDLALYEFSKYCIERRSLL